MKFSNARNKRNVLEFGRVTRTSLDLLQNVSGSCAGHWNGHARQVRFPLRIQSIAFEDDPLLDGLGKYLVHLVVLARTKEGGNAIRQGNNVWRSRTSGGSNGIGGLGRRKVAGGLANHFEP